MPRQVLVVRLWPTQSPEQKTHNLYNHNPETNNILFLSSEMPPRRHAWDSLGLCTSVWPIATQRHLCVCTWPIASYSDCVSTVRTQRTKFRA